MIDQPDDDEALDRLLRPLIPGYLAARREDCHRLEAAIADADADVLRDLGHRLVGSGASYGFPEISALGARLEAAVRRRDFEAGARVAAALAAAVAEAADGDE